MHFCNMNNKHYLNLSTELLTNLLLRQNTATKCCLFTCWLNISKSNFIQSITLLVIIMASYMLFSFLFPELNPFLFSSTSHLLWIHAKVFIGLKPMISWCCPFIVSHLFKKKYSSSNEITTWCTQGLNRGSVIKIIYSNVLLSQYYLCSLHDMLFMNIIVHCYASEIWHLYPSLTEQVDSFLLYTI